MRDLVGFLAERFGVCVYIYRETDRQTDRLTDRKTDREGGREREREREGGGGRERGRERLYTKPLGRKIYHINLC